MDLLTTGRSATARERTQDLAKAIQQLLATQSGSLLCIPSGGWWGISAALPNSCPFFLFPGGVRMAQLMDALRRQSSVEVSVGDVKDALQLLCSEGTVQATGDQGNQSYSMVT